VWEILPVHNAPIVGIYVTVIGDGLARTSPRRAHKGRLYAAIDTAVVCIRVVVAGIAFFIAERDAIPVDGCTKLSQLRDTGVGIPRIFRGLRVVAGITELNVAIS
jgi:hypothetical protein